MSKGIDYGMGRTNVDRETGIRFGVLHQNEVLQAWADSSEADYGEPTCGKCGDTACTAEEVEFEDDVEPDWYDMHADFHCQRCERSFHSEDAYGDEAIAFNLDDGEYTASQGGDDCDIFITKSPYYTRAAFCSPCAPGACYLASPCEDGERAYCFGHEWFDGGKAPYPVYRVSDNSLVQPD